MRNSGVSTSVPTTSASTSIPRCRQDAHCGTICPVDRDVDEHHLPTGLAEQRWQLVGRVEQRAQEHRQQQLLAAADGERRGVERGESVDRSHRSDGETELVRSRSRRRRDGRSTGPGAI